MRGRSSTPSGVCDLADGVALIAARREIPAAGLATGIVALGCAAASAGVARQLRAG